MTTDQTLEQIFADAPIPTPTLPHAALWGFQKAWGAWNALLMGSTLMQERLASQEPRIAKGEAYLANLQAQIQQARDAMLVGSPGADRAALPKKIGDLEASYAHWLGQLNAIRDEVATIKRRLSENEAEMAALCVEMERHENVLIDASGLVRPAYICTRCWRIVTHPLGAEHDAGCGGGRPAAEAGRATDDLARAV